MRELGWIEGRTIVFDRRSARTYEELPRIAEIAAVLLRFVAVYSIFDMMNLIHAAGLRGAGDTVYPMGLTFVLAWVVMLAPAWLGCVRLGAGVYFAWATAKHFVWTATSANVPGRTGRVPVSLFFQPGNAAGYAQAAPFFTHSFIFAENSLWFIFGTVRPSPGLQPHRTKGSLSICPIICSPVFPPLSFGSFNWLHNSPGVRPWKTMGMFSGGMCQLATPGGPPGWLVSRWHSAQFIAPTPLPSGPRLTLNKWVCESSRMSGASPEGWQFRQRGWNRTSAASANAFFAPSAS